MGYLAIVGSRWGRTAGLATIAGITLGLGVYLVASAAGVAQLVLQFPWVLETLRWLGAAYLVWLAVESWRGGADVAQAAGGEGPASLQLFLRGFLANALNPKAAIFYAVLLPNFTEPARGGVGGQMLVLGAIHLAVATTVHAVIVLTASGFNPAIAVWGENNSRTPGRIMALGLLAVAAWLVWDTGRV